MEEEDYLLDDDDDLIESYYQPQEEEDSDEDEEVDESSEDSESVVDKDVDEIDSTVYEGRMTPEEIWLCSAYDDIIKAGKKEKDNAIEIAAQTVVKANPKHTSANTIQLIIKELFQKQGHSRMVNSVYTPDTPLRGEDVDEDFLQEGDGGFNRRFAQEARDQIAQFIEYLSTRDLSKDSIISRRRKQRQLPAFIIFLFSSGMYDLIINCPTMPEEYSKQIDNAMKTILQKKYDIVEELAQRYESIGKPKVADRVRKLQLAWFYKEPAEIRTASEFADLDLTYDDVVIYREYRSRFTNVSRSITQDVISDMIDVVVDKEAGIYEKLKDKTRSDAIADVKQVYKDWAKEYWAGLDVANKVIWKEVNSLTD